MVDLDGVELANDSAMTQVLVNLVLTYRVLDVVVFDLLGPAIVEVVHLARDFSACFEVVRLVDLGVAALAEHAQNQIPILEHGKMVARVVHAAVLGPFLVTHALELLQVEHLLFLEQVQLLLEAALLVLKDLQLELIYFLLLILVDVVVGRLLEVVLALLVQS